MASNKISECSRGDFYVRFWGVRGSLSVSDPDSIRYGGNTSCLEIRCGDRVLMFDAGSGLRELGNHLLNGGGNGGAVDADLFLTHVHYDHVCGIPFFAPFYIPNNNFRVWAGDLEPELKADKIFEQLMTAPLFPVPPSVFQADINYHAFNTGDRIDLNNEITISTAPLNHPNGATGYRVDFAGKSICYLTDTEHVTGEVDQVIVDLIKDADVAIYDAMYTDEEYANCVGFGHSTWRAGAELCEAANVKTFVAFHHEPGHNDDVMDQIKRDIEKTRPGSVVAQEGMILRP